MKNLFFSGPFKKGSDLDWLFYLFGLLVFLYVAFTNYGYFHPDEHYQIIEFAGYIRGENLGMELPWEFSSKVRPSLQPYVCAYIFDALDLLHINDPLSKALALRVITAFLSIFSISWFVKVTLPKIPLHLKYLYLCLSLFLWYLPFVCTRFSSETFSGLITLIAVGLIFKGRDKNIFLTGLLLGFAFLFRFQSALMTVGVFLWLSLINRSSVRKMLFFMASFALVIAFGTLLDWTFYKELTLTPYNYFVVNLVHGVASRFGESPWYAILQYMLFGPSIWIGIPFVIGFAFLVIKEPKNILVWLLLPFVFIHILIGHKELRFLFPMVFFAPLLLINAYSPLLKSFKNIKLLNILISIFILINISVSVFIDYNPKENRRMRIVEYIRNHSTGGSEYLFTEDRNAFKPCYQLNENFYDLKCIYKQSVNQLGSFDFNIKKQYYFTIDLFRYNDDRQLRYSLKKLNFHEVLPPEKNVFKLFSNHENTTLLFRKIQ